MSSAPLAVEPAMQLQLPGARALNPAERTVSLTGQLFARHVDGAYETLLIGLEAHCISGASVWVEQREGVPRPWSGVGYGSDGVTTPRTLLVRRVVDADARIAHIFTEPSDCNGFRGEHLTIALPDTRSAPRDVKALTAWARAMVDSTGDGTWARFARHRMEELYFPKPPEPQASEVANATTPIDTRGAQGRKGAKAARGSTGAKASAQPAPPRAPARRGPLVSAPRRNPSELARLMDTTTGMTSLQMTLQSDRQLLVDARLEAPSVAMGELKGPPMPQHPWMEMMAALGKAVPDEPLARATPADFYFIRFRSLPDLLRVIDELDTWITPAGQVMSGQLEDHELAARLETELGLGRGPLTRTLGPSVVTDLALVGSDPYVLEGSDITVIFRIKAPAAFDAALAATMAGHASKHGGVTASTYQIGDDSGDTTTVTVTRSADGAVRQHRAAVGGFHLVSNSRAGLLRVIHATKGKAPRMSDEPDFRYMLARDSGVRADVLAFMSDRFVSAVVGPRQKILEARRQVALHELLAPGYAALLHGWVYGRAPASVDELIASKLLRSSELRHADGEAISWRPGQPARSSWGTPRALTPLIDLTVPEKVTTLERDAYRWFVEGYERHWRTYIDPVAIRLALEGGAGGPMRMDLRVLPLVDGTDYDELARTVGTARLTTPALQRGMRAVLGIGENAELRRMLRKGSRELPFGGRLEFDWLGDWAAMGMEDHAQPVQLLFATDIARDRRLRLPDEERRSHRQSEADLLAGLPELPVWAGVALRSSAPAAVFLTAIHHELDKVAPGAIDWKEAGKHAGIPFVAIRAGEAGRDMGGRGLRGLLDRLALYYAFCPDSLVLSLSERTLRQRLDECKAGLGPKGSSPGTPGGKQDAQWVMDLGMQRGGPIWRGLGWLLAQMPMQGQGRAADAAAAVLRGLPGSSPVAARGAALDAFGFAPLTAEGREFALGEAGIADPLRGSQHAPRRPALPVDGSPAARLLEQLQQARSEVAFDEEATRRGTAPLRSLHVVVRLRGARE